MLTLSRAAGRLLGLGLVLNSGRNNDGGGGGKESSPLHCLLLLLASLTPHNHGLQKTKQPIRGANKYKGLETWANTLSN